MPRTNPDHSSTKSHAHALTLTVADSNSDANPHSDAFARNVHPFVSDGDCKVV